MKDKLTVNMNGRICLVTGATNGIGKGTRRWRRWAQPSSLWAATGEPCGSGKRDQASSGNDAVEALSPTWRSWRRSG